MNSVLGERRLIVGPAKKGITPETRYRELPKRGANASDNRHDENETVIISIDL